MARYNSATMRRVFTVICGFIALLAIATAVLWERSFRRPAGAEDHLIRHVRGIRYEIRCERGRLALYAPPPRAPNAAGVYRPQSVPGLSWVTADEPSLAGETLAHLLSRTTNDQVAWTMPLDFTSTGRPRPLSAARPSLKAGTPADLLAENRNPAPRLRFAKPALCAALLDALDDPDKFVAAHVILGELTPGPVTSPSYSQRPDGAVLENIAGLTITLVPGHPQSQFSVGPTGQMVSTYQAECSTHADPSQIRSLAAQWHRILDVRVASVPYWQILGAALVLPAVWVLGSFRRSRRRAAGHCRRCGYDLTGNQSGLCPECGTRVPQAVPAAGADAAADEPIRQPPPRKSRRQAARLAVGLSCATGLVMAGVWLGAREFRGPAPARGQPVSTIPQQPIVEAEVGQWVRLGNVELRARSVGIGTVQRADGADFDTRPKLWAQIELRNRGNVPLSYLTWNDCFHPLPPRELAEGRDDENRVYRAARWDFLYPPMEGVVRSTVPHFDADAGRRLAERQKSAADELDRAKQRFQSEYGKLTDDNEPATPQKLIARQRILSELISTYYRASKAVEKLETEASHNPKPDGTLSDRLVLAPQPREDSGYIDLDLPGRNVGETGTFRIHITGRLLHPFKVWEDLRASELTGLIGKTASSPELQRLLDALPNRHRSAGPGKGYSESSARLGLTLRFGESLQLETITLRGNGSAFSQGPGYPGELPAELLFTDSYAEVRQKLGPPESESELDTLVTMNYPRRGLAITFTRNAGVKKENAGPILLLRIHAPGSTAPRYNPVDAADLPTAGENP